MLDHLMTSRVTCRSPFMNSIPATLVPYPSATETNLFQSYLWGTPQWELRAFGPTLARSLACSSTNTPLDRG